MRKFDSPNLDSRFLRKELQMEELVRVRKDRAVTTSLQVAEMFHKRHQHVLRDIQGLDCSDDFRLHNFAESHYMNEQNHRQPMYYLTKDGFTFLVMGYKGKKAAEFKEKYIKAFNTMEKVIMEKSTEAWLQTRSAGMLTRKSETDTIKELVEYAKEQGSTHSDMLYVTYTKLANTMTGVKSRENATVTQLNNLSIFENLILQMIRNGMAAGLGYKDIYRECKARCQMAQQVAMIGG